MVSRGICGQRGFLEFCLVGKPTGKPSIVAINPANPLYRLYPNYMSLCHSWGIFPTGSLCLKGKNENHHTQTWETRYPTIELA